MCQGVIVSIAKFKVKNRTRRVVLYGIGSHSEMFAANKELLVKRGWTDSLLCDVVSAESDFTSKKWGKFTVESGTPDKRDALLLRSEFKRCSGSAHALIAHVRRVGRIDDALLRLLTQSAWAEYEKVTQSAWAEYQKVTQPALAEYEKVRQPAWAEYEKVRQSAWAEYVKVGQPAWAEYVKVKQSAWIKLFAKRSNRLF